jgi:hypothetical protein
LTVDGTATDMLQVLDEPAVRETGWRVVAASVAGASHEADGTPCQDAFAYRLLPGDVALAVVADGAGSAEAAEIGARLAVETALEALAVELCESIVEDRAAAIRAAFLEARETIAHRAADDGRPLAAYATTLTCLVAWREGAIIGRVGDGFAVVADVEDGLRALPPSRPDRGEYANETVFLTGPDGDDRLEIAELEGPIGGVAVSTDGLLRLAIELASYRPHARFFRPLFAFARQTDPETADGQLAAFLASDRVRARTDDDATLVLAVLVEPEGPESGAGGGGKAEEGMAGEEGAPDDTGD